MAKTNKPEVIEEVILVDPFTITRFPRQPRKESSFDENWIAWLADSMKNDGQTDPVFITPYYGSPKPGIKYFLIDGENRCRAARKAGILLKAIVRQVKNERDHYLKSAVANFFRLPHTEMEIAEVVRELRDGEKMTWAQIEKKIGMNQITVRRYYDLGNLDPSIQNLIGKDVSRSDRLPISVASELSKLPPNEQLRIIGENQIKNKSAALAVQLIRKRVQVIEAAGGSVIQAARGRKRKPSDDVDVFGTHVRRIETEFNFLLGMITDLKVAVRHRGLERNGETMQSVVQLENLAGQLSGKVLEAMPDSFRAAYIRKPQGKR